MAIAAFVAFRALKNGETPVACIFVHEPTLRVLSFGCNDTNRSLNGTKHAEFVAIDKILQDHDLLAKLQEEIRDFFRGLTLFVTVEPCVMCALAIKQLGIGKVFFGAANDRFGGNGTVIKIQDDETYKSYGGIMRVEAVQLLRNFYIQENNSAPVPKIKKNKEIGGKEFPPNLDFGRYLTKEQFVETFGEVRLEKFYDERSPNLEITPIAFKGYEFLHLLAKSDLLKIPHLFELYPLNDMDIDRDILDLDSLLPRIGNNGRVFWGSP